MIKIKSQEEIEIMREACRITRDALKVVEDSIKVGVSTKELDQIAFDYIKSQGATPSFKNYSGFPASICASVNDTIVHGIPSKDIVLKEGDIIICLLSDQSYFYIKDIYIKTLILMNDICIKKNVRFILLLRPTPGRVVNPS